MYSHYSKQGSTHYMTISKTTRPVGLTEVFGSKKEAVAYAKKVNAKAWNY